MFRENSSKKSRMSQVIAGEINAVLDFAEAVKEKRVVGDGFFEELLEQKHFGTVDDGVDAVLESFHRHERLKRIAQQNYGRVTALAGRHGLQGLKREIFINGIRAKKFLDDDDLIMKLAETHAEIGVRGGGVNLVAEFLQGGFRGFEPFRCGKCKQRRFVVGSDEFK